MHYVGIDYHKRYSFVSVLNEEGQLTLERRVDHRQPEAFEAVVRELKGQCQVVYEVTSNWGWLYDILERIKGVESIRLAHPYQTRIIAAAQIKTDKIDARKLAMLLRADLIPCAHVPTRRTRERKEVLRQRVFWVKQRTRLRNRVHRIISRQHRLAMPQVTDLFGKKGMEALSKAQLPEPDSMLLHQNLQMLQSVGAQIKEAEKKIDADGLLDGSVELLQSIPGIGLILGNVIATEIDDISRFIDPSKLSAYAGLVPSTSSSGDKTFHGPMLRQCNKWLKWAFIEAAWVAVGCSPYFGGFYRSHVARGKKKNVAISIVAHRMCQIAFRLLKEKRLYEERPLKTFSPAALQRD